MYLNKKYDIIAKSSHYKI